MLRRNHHGVDPQPAFVAAARNFTPLSQNEIAPHILAAHARTHTRRVGRGVNAPYLGGIGGGAGRTGAVLLHLQREAIDGGAVLGQRRLGSTGRLERHPTEPRSATTVQPRHQQHNKVSWGADGHLDQGRRRSGAAQAACRGQQQPALRRRKILENPTPCRGPRVHPTLSRRSRHPQQREHSTYIFDAERSSSWIPGKRVLIVSSGVVLFMLPT